MTKTEAEYIAATLEIIKRPLSDEAPAMVSELREAEGRVGYLYFLLAAANAELDRQTAAACEVLKAQDLKAYALEAQAEAMVSGWRKERDEIQGLIRALEGRTMVGLGILKYWKSLPQE